MYKLPKSTTSFGHFQACNILEATSEYVMRLWEWTTTSVKIHELFSWHDSLSNLTLSVCRTFQLLRRFKKKECILVCQGYIAAACTYFAASTYSWVSTSKET